MGLKWTTQRTIGQLVKKHEPFLLGNVSAKLYKKGESINLGRLETFQDMNDLIDKSRESDVYVVYSFQTPIGWCKMDEPDNWHIPQILYSVITTHHQNVLAAVISS